MKQSATLLGVVGAALGLTVAPGLTWLDAGELGAAAAELGIAHPPGFPLFALLHKAGMLLVPVGDIAFRGNLVSAALLIGACLLLRQALRLAGCGASVATFAALLLPLSGLVLLHAQTIEVYTGGCLWTAAVLWAWMGLQSGDQRYALALGGLLGLALSHHAELRLLGLPVGIGLCWRLRANKRALALAVAAGLVGALVLLYLPLRAASDPLRNWGDPSTAAAFWDHFTGARIRTAYAAQFGDLSLTDVLTYFEQLGAHSGVLFGLGALGFALGRGPGRTLAVGLFLLDTLYATALNPMGLRDLQNGATGAVALAFGAGLFLHRLTAFGEMNRRSHLLWGAASILALFGAGLAADPVARRHDSAHTDLMAATLDQAPPEALVLVVSDSFAAGLIFQQVVEGARPDLAILPRQHMWDASAVEPVRARVPNALAGWSAAPSLAGLEALKREWPVLWEWGAGLDAAHRPSRLKPAFPLFAQTAEATEPLADLKRFVQLRPGRFETPDARKTLAFLLSDLGMAYLGARDPRALHAFRDATEMAPDSARSWRNLGAALQRFGLLSQAIEATRRAADLAPRDAGVALNLARYLNAAGTSDQAMEWVNTALDLAPENADAWALRGVLKGNAGDLAGAKADFEAALQHNPKQEEALAGMALMERTRPR